MEKSPRINDNKKQIFESLPVPRAVAEMAVPTIISQIIALIYNIADTWFIGLTNDPYKVAGCSLVLPVFLMTIAFTNLFGMGGGTLISRLLGMKEEDEARRVSAFSITAAFVSAACYSLSCLLFMDPLLRFLGASNNTIGYARQYIFFVIVLGGVPTVMTTFMSTILRSLGYSKPASIGLSMGGILNIAFDPLFMFVILPDGQQVMGAAIATMLSNCCAVTFFIIMFRRLIRAGQLSADLRQGLPQRASVRSVFGVGIPAALSVLLFDVANVVINRLASSYGDVELAAIGIVLKIERLPLNIGVGLSLGMVPLVAYNYAAGNYKRMNEVFRFGRIVGLAVAVTCAVLYHSFAPAIMRFFIRDAATVSCGTTYLKARCLATPLMFLCFTMVHFMQALGNGRLSFLLACVRQLVFNIPMLFLLNSLWGMEGIVWSQLVSDLFTVIVSYTVYMRLKKKEGF